MNTTAIAKIRFVDWGQLPYKEAFLRQKNLVDEIIQGRIKEHIVFCTHPPVVTLGRGTQDGDVFSWSGETVEVNRGGRATYHGPNQLIMYPLISLDKLQEQRTKKKIPTNDLHAYMRALELSVIDVLSLYNITAQARSLQKQVGEDQEKEATGVWVKDKKIAAIGIGVKSWVTSHGIALNVWKDKKAFQGIYPCGFEQEQVISLEDLIHQNVERRVILQQWMSAIKKRLFMEEYS